MGTDFLNAIFFTLFKRKWYRRYSHERKENNEHFKSNIEVNNFFFIQYCWYYGSVLHKYHLQGLLKTYMN